MKCGITPTADIKRNLISDGMPLVKGGDKNVPSHKKVLRRGRPVCRLFFNRRRCNTATDETVTEPASKKDAFGRLFCLMSAVFIAADRCSLACFLRYKEHNENHKHIGKIKKGFRQNTYGEVIK